jgi:hypothetical protein
MQQMKTHFSVLSDIEELERSTRMKINKSWEQSGDKFQILNDVIKFVNNKTKDDLKLLDIKEITTFIMTSGGMNVKHKLILYAQHRCQVVQDFVHEFNE